VTSRSPARGWQPLLIDRIVDLLKLDIEGAAIAALKGARWMLAGKRIGLIQFDSLPAVSARVYLRDFFDLLDDWEIHRMSRTVPCPSAGTTSDGEILWTANYLAVPSSH
jgi:hypothetical protein